MMMIHVNQVGYLPGMRKPIAIVDAQPGTLEVLDAAGRVVWSQSIEPQPVLSWGDAVTWADVGAVTEPGAYTVRLGTCVSPAFRVGEDVYQPLLAALVDMFWYQRCGCALDERAGVFAHPACHTAPARIWDTEERIDVSGGWHDAGDYGRYVVPAAKAVADLMLAYYANPKAFGSHGITELRSEIRWELEWMLKMQREDGGVYHKVTYPTFTALNNMPEADTREQVVLPVSTTATGDFAAACAMATAFFIHDGPFSARLLDAALRAQAFLDAHPEPILFRNPEGVRTGGYGDGSDADERLWALVELGRTLGGFWQERAAAELARADLSRVPLGWADVRGYAVIAGLRMPGETGRICRERVQQEAERLSAAIHQPEAYRTAMLERVVWGSNMIVANDGVMLAGAYTMNKDRQTLDDAAQQLHYLLGVNPMGRCYVSGFGSKPMRHPHHRPSVARGQAVPGMLSGGPCQGLADARAKELLQGCEPGKCYLDDAFSYSTNEICVYWNSPMVTLLAALMR